MWTVVPLVSPLPQCFWVGQRSPERGMLSANERPVRTERPTVDADRPTWGGRATDGQNRRGPRATGDILSGSAGALVPSGGPIRHATGGGGRAGAAGIEGDLRHLR